MDEAAEELRDAMILMSEKYHSYRWWDNVEYSFWEEIIEARGVPLMSPGEIFDLIRLCCICRGWVIKGEDGECIFVPIDQWIKMYGEKRANDGT